MAAVAVALGPNPHSSSMLTFAVAVAEEQPPAVVVAVGALDFRTIVDTSP